LVRGEGLNEIVPCCPAVSWTGGDFASDGAEADESYSDRHGDEMNVRLLWNENGEGYSISCPHISSSSHAGRSSGPKMNGNSIHHQDVARDYYQTLLLLCIGTS
jgi:hypothetical protein